jgi:hypothetical protein
MEPGQKSHQPDAYFSSSLFNPYAEYCQQCDSCSINS